MATKELAVDVAARPRPAPPQAKAEAAPALRISTAMPAAGPTANVNVGSGVGPASATAPDVVSRARASIMLQQSVGNARMGAMGAELATMPSTRLQGAPNRPEPLMTTQQTPGPAPVPAVAPPKPEPTIPTPAAPPVPADKANTASTAAPAPAAKETPPTAPAKKGAKSGTRAAASKSLEPAPPAEQSKAAALAPKAGSAKAKPAAAKKGKGGKGGVEEGEGEPKAEAKAGGKGGGHAVPIKMPEPPAGLSPAAHARVGAAQAGAGHAAAAHSALTPATDQVADARAGVTEPSAEANARAAADLVTALGQRPAPSPEIEELCKKIYKVIHDKRPPDEDSLVKADPEKMGAAAGKEMDASVQGGVKKVDQSYQTMGQQPQGTPGQQGQPIPAAPDPAGTPPINADQAKPDAVPAKNVDLKADAADSKERMGKAGINKEPAKLVQSGPIAEAREAQGDLEKTAAEDPAKVLGDQQATLVKTGADLAALQKTALASLNASRKSTVSHTSGQQKQLVGSEESMRTKASAEAQSIFTNAQNQVNALLQPLPQTAKSKWDAGVKLATTKFKQRLKKVEDWIKDRHSGGWGAVVSVWDDVTGLPGWVTDEYDAAEQTFGDEICATAREISSDVNGIILTCETIIANARSQIAAVFAALPAGLQAWAAGEQAKLGEQLDGLTRHAHEVRDNFNKELIQSASQAVQDVREQVHSLREKAKGLIGRVMDAINRFLDDPAKFLLEALLEILGIPPSAFWAVVNKIKKVINDIADDPMKFANNLMDAIGKGFSQFFDHIADHLLRGFIDWLTGGLGSLGIQLPKDASLKSILTFMLQLMGITWPRIRKLLAKHIGEKNIALIEKVYSLVSTLIELGPEGVFELIKEQLNPKNILNMIIKAAVDYMITAVIKAVSARIILLFNPVGAVLQALEAIYRVLKWVFQNAARIFKLIETVVNGIADIIAGNIGGMANAVERALAMLIPPVIDFLADYLGFGDLPNTIRETIEGFQENVMEVLESVLVWLIEKGKALLGLGGKDKKKKKEADEGAIGKKLTWTAAEEDHQLWVTVKGTNAVVMMSSDKPEPVEKHLETYAKQADAITADKDKKSVALAAISEAKGALSPVDKSADEAASLVKKPEHDSNELKTKEQQVEAGEEALKAPLEKIQNALPPSEPPETKVEPTDGAKASFVKAEPLSKKAGNTKGSRPNEDPPGWDHVLKVDREELNPKKKQWGPAYWVRMHLLSELLHGPGAAWNLVPARKTDNSAMLAGPEIDAKERIAKKEVLYYDVKVSFHTGEILQDFPKSVNVIYGSMKYENKAWVRAGQIDKLPLSPDPPPLDAGGPVPLHTVGRDTLSDTFHFPRMVAEHVAAESKAGPYGTPTTFLARMKARYLMVSPSVNFEFLYWPTVQGLMKKGNLQF